jgi:hypothetical protein
MDQTAILYLNQELVNLLASLILLARLLLLLTAASSLSTTAWRSPLQPWL